MSQPRKARLPPAARKILKDAERVAKHPPRTLGAVLAYTQRNAHRRRTGFLARLVAWVWAFPGRRSLPFDELSATAQMILALVQVHGAISSGGMSSVFDWQVGDRFHQIHGWLRTIGARNTANYFAAAARLMPRRRVPADRRARRRVAEALSDRALYALDTRYRESALHEIPDRLRVYVGAHRHDIERDLSTAAREDSGTASDDILSKGDMLQAVADIQRRAERSKEGFGYPTVTRPGDVVELSYRGRRRYLQVTHDHPFARTIGPVCRLLPGKYRVAVSKARLITLVQGRTEFFLNFNVDSVLNRDRGLHEGEARILGRFPVPVHARVFPTFLYRLGVTRAGSNVWRFWKGKRKPTGQVVGPLQGVRRTWPVLRYSHVAADILKGWTPRSALSSYGEK